MPFDHNDHYHRLLLRHVPQGSSTALDVGCGAGRFAYRLARLGLEVDAVDPSQEIIAQARTRAAETGGSGPRFACADITAVELPKERYDFISCLASIHHMPFGTVTALREALAPGGVLVILGCYPERTWLDRSWSLAAVPVNVAVRLFVAGRDRVWPKTTESAMEVKAPVKRPDVPLVRIRQEAAVLLPGCDVRRLLFWRYLLVYRSGR